MVQVSPHEFMQAVMLASKKKFKIESQSDTVEFLSWLLNTLHFDLTGGKPRKRSVIHDSLQVRRGSLGVIYEQGWVLYGL